MFIFTTNTNTTKMYTFVQSILDVIDFCVYGCVWLLNDWDMYDSLKHLIAHKHTLGYII